jgi:aubergine-like protein
MEFKACDLGEFSSRKGLETIEDELRYRAKKDSYNIYLIVLPNALKTSYKKIKKICLVDLKLVSQIVTQFTLGRKEFNSIATKVLLQMAAKVGNTLWVPKPMESLRGVRIMLVGVDSTADKNSKGKIIGFCASLNESHTKYFSSTIVQDSSSTVLEKMKELMCRSIKAYTDENKYPPNEIVVLRDGCSAGEIRSIRESEVENSLEALKLIDSHISLTYIVIDKKVSQKFFGQYNGNACNPQAGTLVNTDLVSENYDFYLVSQFSMRGTTVPTYYKVIYSDSKLE